MTIPQRKLVIAIGPDGQVRTTVHGVKGKACLDATKEVEAALGQVVERQFTSEYYEGDSGGSVERLSSIE